MRDLVVEFLGTFFLVLTVGFSGGDPLAIGAVLMIMVYIGGHLSGGHYNPAVSTAVWLRGRLRTSRWLAYMLAQIVGACTAGCLYYFLNDSFFGPTPNVPVSHAVILEFIYTLALCLTVLTVATTAKLKGNQIYGLAIGFAVLAGVASIGSMTGAALNPAVATGPALTRFLFGTASWSVLWIYWVGPMAAGMVAGILYRFIYKLSPLISIMR
ncbi:MAG: aquaporin family protein [Chlamydiia bacterium]|nr:aquaporin family protein [Chlamydiia bacterium]